MTESQFEVIFTGVEHRWVFRPDASQEDLERIIEGMSFTDSLMLQAICHRINTTCTRLRIGEG